MWISSGGGLDLRLGQYVVQTTHFVILTRGRGHWEPEITNDESDVVDSIRPAVLPAGIPEELLDLVDHGLHNVVNIVAPTHFVGNQMAQFYIYIM